MQMISIVYKFISKINNVLIDNEKKLHFVMSIYSWIEHSKGCKKTIDSLWNYHRDESADPKTTSFKSLKYKTSIGGIKVADGNTKEVEFAIQLKYLSNVLRTLGMPLINCEVNLILTWSKDCVLTDTATRAAGAQGNSTETRPRTG